MKAELRREVSGLLVTLIVQTTNTETHASLSGRQQALEELNIIANNVVKQVQDVVANSASGVEPSS